MTKPTFSPFRGARVINAASTFPAADPDVYLVWRGSIDSNVYRLRLTQ